MAAYRRGREVNCGMTACTLGSALGPTLGNKYWRTTLYFSCICQLSDEEYDDW